MLPDRANCAKYFDTNVIRYLGTGLAGQCLPQEHKARIVLSAVSAIELVSQVAVSPQDALDAIHRFESWLNTDRAILLDWSETFVGEHVFGLNPDLTTFTLLTQVLGVCYRTNRPNDRLVADAQRLREFNERAKRQKAELFQNTANSLRQRALSYHKHNSAQFYQPQSFRACGSNTVSKITQQSPTPESKRH